MCRCVGRGGGGVPPYENHYHVYFSDLDILKFLPGMCFFLMSALQDVLLQLIKRHQFIALVANFFGLIQVILQHKLYGMEQRLTAM